MKAITIDTIRGQRKFKVLDTVPCFTYTGTYSTTEIYYRPHDCYLLKVTIGAAVFVESGAPIGDVRKILIDNALAFLDIPKATINQAKPEIADAVQAFKAQEHDGEQLE
jgi:hypothetical protein